MSDEEGYPEDENDPDYIAAHPPEKVVDPKTFFKTGENEGKWSEYDERGVPSRTAKKKKPSKKEKDALEVQYLDAKRKYQQYLQEVQAHNLRKMEAEAALEQSDVLRWAFRKIGDKNSPIILDELEEFFQLVGWGNLRKREISALKKVASEESSSDGEISLEALRTFTQERMAARLIEERLNRDVFEDIEVQALRSPRAWRRRLEAEPVAVAKPTKESRSTRKEGDESRSRKSKRDNLESPRGRKSTSPQTSPGRKSEKRR
mmetsp:Transcript_107662/g.213952  ORF Transcript_107662/g.213952 Transcript_107662/m.213952 type:complete len:261 (+) Transcript_107662:114-896(+)